MSIFCIKFFIWFKKKYYYFIFWEKSKVCVSVSDVCVCVCLISGDLLNLYWTMDSRRPIPRSDAPPPQVNIIPVIAKADTISKSELQKFKLKIMSELVSNGVQIYQFPTDDDAVASINSAMNVRPTQAFFWTVCLGGFPEFCLNFYRNSGFFVRKIVGVSVAQRFGNGNSWNIPQAFVFVYIYFFSL